MTRKPWSTYIVIQPTESPRAYFGHPEAKLADIEEKRQELVPELD